MAYSADTFVADEQPTTAKWNKLWTNDAAFNDGSGFAAGALGSVNASLAAGITCQFVYNTDGAVATGSTTIPNDDTPPQITEGTQFMTQAITPKAVTNILEIEFLALISGSGGAVDIIGAIFQDATASALAAMTQRGPTADTQEALPVRHIMAAGTTSSTTFRLRVGAGTASTITFNGSAGVRRFNTIAKSSATITEYKA